MARSETLTEIDGRRLALSNLAKELYPSGQTKAEVISYYLHIAPVLLPHIADRPLTRLRAPDGAAGPTFYEKNAPAGTPDWVRVRPVQASDGPIDYVVADDAATVVWLANLAALELHVPQWRFASTGPGRLRLPESATDAPLPLHDRLVIDLDPGEGITMIESARAALLAGGLLARDGLVPVCRTSGGKGLQVAAAIAPADGTASRDYVRGLAAELVRTAPDLFVDQMARSARAGRIFVDYNQNQTFRNTVAPYSLRIGDHPRVATPLTWDELGAVQTPDALRFGPDEVLARVAEHGDFAADLLLDDPPPLPASD